jgi:putative zinc metalloproteinase T16A9.4
MDYSDNYTLIMEDLNYFKGLTRLLKRTPKRVIANYLGWRFIYNFADYTVREFRHMFFEYQKLSEGITRPEKNWEFCYSLMNTYFNFIIGRLYIDNFFNSSTVNEIESMTKYIIASFKDSLSKQTWMNRGTRVRAKQKVS